MTTATAPRKRRWQDVEATLCRKSYPHFVRRVRIKDPPPGGGIVSPAPWPHLLALDGALTSYRLLVVPKAKQIGISWRLAAYALWTAMYHQGALVVLYSAGEREAVELLDGKIRVIYDLLPSHLQQPLRGAGSRTELEFPSLHSRIIALPATQAAGVGLTATLVVMDEADFHERFQECYDTAAKPTADAGGQVVIASTVNPASIDSGFKRLVRGAGDGAPGPNGFARVFFPYDVRPGRDQAWYDAGLAAALDPPTFSKNYPRTVAEALAPAQAAAFFDTGSVEALLADCREPEMRQGGLIRTWRRPVVAGRYLGFGDVCWGHQSAYSCFVLADWATGEQVAEIYGRPEHDEYAQAIANLVAEYNKAYFSIEANGETTERSGLNVINKLVALGVGNRMYHHGEHWEKEERDRGFLTTSVTRPEMLGELAEHVRLRGVVPHCKDVVSEMGAFVRNERGRPEALAGAYADHVMAWAGWTWLKGRGYAHWGTAPGSKPVRMVWGWK